MDKNKITLKEFTDSHLPIIEKWLNKDYIKKWYGEPEDWLDEIKNISGEFGWMNHFIVMYEETEIGFCQYFECDKAPKGFEWDDEPKGTFAIDYLIGEEAYLDKGLSKIIIQQLHEFIISKENPFQIIADPVKENLVSINLLETSGYHYDLNTGLYKFKI